MEAERAVDGPDARASAHQQASGSASITERLENVIKSPNDDRQYRVIVLPNQLKALLIHDATADKASAALDVHVGSMCDPDNLPGLAHFLEHMLFLGTVKFPKENEYSQFLAEHGGGSNAFTSQEHTNYHFEVAHDQLYGALDRFAQFFIAPLFAQDGTERELRAVDSENKKNLQNDSWRLYQLEKSLSNPNHPYHKFSTGNLQTLWELPREQNVDVRQALLDFHARYYSANIMGLVVLGRDPLSFFDVHCASRAAYVVAITEPLDQLERWVAELFTGVPNQNIPIPSFSGHPLDSSCVQKRVEVVPIKDIYAIELEWPFPELIKLYQSKPERYLSHLIGHEGKGSILSLLKKKGYGNGLSAGSSHGHLGFDTFKVTVEATEDGLAHIDEVVGIILAYIRMLKTEPVHEWIYNECRDLAAIAFRFKEKERAISYTTHLASGLQQYPADVILTSRRLFMEYAPHEIERLLALLAPEAFRLVVVDPKVSSASDLQQEHYYGTQFRIRPFTTDESAAYHNPPVYSELSLPPPNTFIPDDFELVEPRSAGTLGSRSLPEELRSTSLSRLWYKQDDTFKIPRAYVRLLICNPMVMTSPGNVALLNLLVEVLIDQLIEYAYDADLAGLRFDVYSQPEGIDLALEGYNDKMVKLLTKMLDTLVALGSTAAQDRFIDLKDRLLRSYRGWNKENPLRQVMQDTLSVVEEHYWTYEQKEEALSAVSFEEFKIYAQALLKRAFVEVLVHGNVTPATAVVVAEMVETKLGASPLTRAERRRRRSLKLPLGSCSALQQPVLDPDNVNSAVEVYFETCQDEDERQRCLTYLAVELLHEAAFTQLRTKEQLGYIVQCSVRRNASAMGLRMLVQSERSPAYLYERIHAFLTQQRDVIKEMGTRDFHNYVQSIITRKLEKDKQLKQEATRYYNEILNGYFDFGRVDTEVAILKQLGQYDLLHFYQQHLLDPVSRAVLVTGRQSPKAQADNWPSDVQVISDLADFREGLELYPVPRPVGHPARASRSGLQLPNAGVPGYIPS